VRVFGLLLDSNAQSKTHWILGNGALLLESFLVPSITEIHSVEAIFTEAFPVV